MLKFKIVLTEIAIILSSITGIVSLNCMALESTNSYDGTRSGTGFEVLVSSLKEGNYSSYPNKCDWFYFYF